MSKALAKQTDYYGYSSSCCQFAGAQHSTRPSPPKTMLLWSLGPTAS